MEFPTSRAQGLIVAFLVSACLGICRAQDDGGERYYLYQAGGISTPQREKELTEVLRGFDGEMVVSLDQPTQRLKLVTTVILVENDVIAMAAQVGVSLVRIPPHSGPHSTSKAE
ncbi:MAG: hypothetical protein WAU70_00580 [Flavobacteriales bacterium]